MDPRIYQQYARARGAYSNMHAKVTNRSFGPIETIVGALLIAFFVGLAFLLLLIAIPVGLAVLAGTLVALGIHRAIRKLRHLASDRSRPLSQHRAEGGRRNVRVIDRSRN